LCGDGEHGFLDESLIFIMAISFHVIFPIFFSSFKNQIKMIHKDKPTSKKLCKKTNDSYYVDDYVFQCLCELSLEEFSLLFDVQPTLGVETPSKAFGVDVPSTISSVDVPSNGLRFGPSTFSIVFVQLVAIMCSTSTTPRNVVLGVSTIYTCYYICYTFFFKCCSRC